MQQIKNIVWKKKINQSKYKFNEINWSNFKEKYQSRDQIIEFYKIHLMFKCTEFATNKTILKGRSTTSKKIYISSHCGQRSWKIWNEKRK